MPTTDVVRTVSVGLAGALLLVVVLALSGVTVSPPGGADAAAPSVPFLAVPVALVVTVLLRPLRSRDPTDVVLAACAAPALLAGAYAGYEHYAAGGVRWGGAFVLAGSLLLATAVVADAVVRAELRRRRT